MRKGIFFLSIFTLSLLYISAIFAPFIAPYEPSHQFRDFPLAPPTKIHFFERCGKLFCLRPHVFKYYLEDPLTKTYREDREKKFYIRFFKNKKLISVEEGGYLFLLGCDDLGRDIFSRLIYGGRISLSVGFVGVFISFVIGLFVGSISGYFGGLIDTAIMRLTEILMSIPTFFLLISLSVVIPANISSGMTFLLIISIMSFIGWASFARVIRGIVLSLREADYVLAGKSLGGSAFWIIRKHIIPQTMSYTIVACTLSIPSYILGESALSMLGLGIKEPDPSWGNMLSRALNITLLSQHPYLITPGFLIFITVISFNFLGDYLRDINEPKGKG
jgi:peptide/nickel transport system permease protein